VVNTPPTAFGSAITLSRNTPYSGQLSASDADGDSLTYSIVTNGSLGTAVVTNSDTGAFTYTPNTDATGNDTYTFKVNDGLDDSTIETVTVAILEATIQTKVFGDTPDTDQPGSLEDTYANVNTNVNASLGTLLTYSWTPSAPHRVANTIVIKADLAALPPYATVIDARLYLYQNGYNGETVYTNSVHKITGVNPIVAELTGYNAFTGQPWTPVPANTTYNNIPLGLADIGPAEDAVQLDTQQGYRSWLVSTMVQEWITDPATNYGLLIKGVETAIETGRSFASSEDQSAGIRPKLVVRYTIVPPPPSLILIEEIK